MLAGLPDQERLAITMALYQGLSCRQVAWAMQQPEPAVKCWISSGLRRMRSQLDGAAGPTRRTATPAPDRTDRERALHLV